MMCCMFLLHPFYWKTVRSSTGLLDRKLILRIHTSINPRIYVDTVIVGFMHRMLQDFCHDITEIILVYVATKDLFSRGKSKVFKFTPPEFTYPGISLIVKSAAYIKVHKDQITGQYKTAFEPKYEDKVQVFTIKTLGEFSNKYEISPAEICYIMIHDSRFMRQFTFRIMFEQIKRFRRE